MSSGDRAFCRVRESRIILAIVMCFRMLKVVFPLLAIQMDFEVRLEHEKPFRGLTSYEMTPI